MKKLLLVVFALVLFQVGVVLASGDDTSNKPRKYEDKMHRDNRSSGINYSGQPNYDATDNDDDTGGNSDEVLQRYNPNNVFADQTQPQYVTSYLDKENHHAKSLMDVFVRLGLGLDADAIKYSQSENSSFSQEQNYSAVGFFGSLEFGLGKRIADDNFYLGAALDGQFNSAKVTNDSTIGKKTNELTLKLPYSFGVYFVPGFVVSPKTMVYGKFGLGAASFQAETDQPYYYGVDSFSKNLLSIRGGVGVQTFVSEGLSVDFEYLFSYYGANDENFTSYGITYKNEFTPMTNQISIGFAYHF